MARNTGNVSRSPAWTAWDANTRFYRRPAKFRKVLRRAIKRRQNQMLEKEVQTQTEKGDVIDGSYESAYSAQ